MKLLVLHGDGIGPEITRATLAVLQAGDGRAHDTLLAAIAPRFAGCDALMLAQFSTARARDAVAAAVKCPVLTSPDSAVLAMKKLLS